MENGETEGMAMWMEGRAKGIGAAAGGWQRGGMEALVGWSGNTEGMEARKGWQL